MPDKPAAEFAIHPALVRALLAAQATHVIPDAASLPLEKVAEGWDSEVWRLGSDHAVRLPRRELAAPLVRHEQRVLPAIAERLAATGVHVPAPEVSGAPGCGYPWAWSVVPWIDGDRGMDVARADRSGWAETLAAALGALHVDAPADHPRNPVRGGPLAERAAAFEDRLAALRAADTIAPATAASLEEVWRAGLSATAWQRPPVWIHGDLHPGNLISHAGRLVGVIDFGDVTGGDPAYDLAVAWLAFDGIGRAAFRAATDSRYDHATWQRAKAWAAAVALILLVHSDDNPDYEALGRDAAAEIIDDTAD